MHRNHLLPCAAMLAVAVIVALVWGIQLGTLALVGVMLLCPLVMLLMLRAMATTHRGPGAGQRADQASDLSP